VKRNVFIYLMSMSRSISTGPEGELIRVASVGLGATIEGGAASQQVREWLSTVAGSPFALLSRLSGRNFVGA
jgi:hypothetical protein